MVEEWYQRVGSSIPRGFSRYFVLETLEKNPHTGKEIIESAQKESSGIWKASPGLIYPLLARLTDEGLIEEKEGGKYHITEKGIKTSKEVGKIYEIFKKQIDVIFRLGNAGCFIASDLIERFIALGNIIGSNIQYLSDKETERYLAFLKLEIKKIEEIKIKN